MFKNRQLGNSSESGGILLGSYRGNHIEVIDATLPGKKDIRRKNEFIRIDKHHQIYAEKLWRKSEGKITYIGEWHTHPTNTPSPSPIDIAEWNKKLPNRNMILCIQGISDLALFVSNYNNKSKEIKKLEVL